MEEQSDSEKEVVINMEKTDGPHYVDLVEESSTPRSNQDIQEEPLKKPKVPEKNEGHAPISNNNEGPPLLLELDFMRNKDESSTPKSSQQQEGCKIPKVPGMLRDLKKYNGCFDPRVVSIGPYHHGKSQLQKFEELKTKLAWQYCENSPGIVNSSYKKVENVAREAREFYDVEGLNDIDDKAFTKMMFLDGCFILEFMLTCLQLMGEEKYHTVKMTNNDIANVKQDLFLLENQLPYNVLEALMKGNEEYKYEWEEIIKNFITMCRKLPPAVEPWMSFFWSPRVHKFEYPFHLLDMTRARFVKQSATSPSRLRRQVQHRMGIRSSSIKTATPSATSDWYSYHSARVLKSMGIWFRPNKTGSFSDVKFESQLFIRGVLTLPPILIDASTKSLLVNMLAFESSYTNLQDKQGVTSYMCFMDSLIDNADDVMILSSENVIVNCLGTDQDVADLFNDIANNLVPNPHTYAEAKLGIQKHCTNKFKKWMAECLHTHFRSPWTLLALCGAIFVILLTVAQTYLAAKPPKN